MATTPAFDRDTAKPRKTAEQLLKEKMGELVEQASRQMNDKEFKRAHEESRAIISRVRGQASPRDTK